MFLEGGGVWGVQPPDVPRSVRTHGSAVASSSVCGTPKMPSFSVIQLPKRCGGPTFCGAEGQLLLRGTNIWEMGLRVIELIISKLVFTTLKKFKMQISGAQTAPPNRPAPNRPAPKRQRQNGRAETVAPNITKPPI